VLMGGSSAAFEGKARRGCGGGLEGYNLISKMRGAIGWDGVMGGGMKG
jgi:hypothetical protein